MILKPQIVQLIFLIFAICLNLKLSAQNPNGSPYIEISYMKQTSSDYQDFETNTWKEINQKVVNNGDLSGWYFYKVKYPGGENAEYGYVTISVFENWDKINQRKQSTSEIWSQSGHDMTWEELVAKTDASRKVVWRQLLSLEGIAVKSEAEPSKYMVVNQLKSGPGQSRKYVDLENTYFKPFHEERAKEKIMNNWSLYRLNMPMGDKYPYDFITFNGYADWDDITKQNPPTAWKKAHGNLNFNLIHDDILSKRATINIETWELIDYALPK